MHITETQPIRRLVSGDLIDTDINYETNLKFSKFSIFGQISKTYLNQKLGLSLGVRSDLNTYSSEMSNPLESVISQIFCII